MLEHGDGGGVPGWEDPLRKEGGGTGLALQHSTDQGADVRVDQLQRGSALVGAGAPDLVDHHTECFRTEVADFSNHYPGFSTNLEYVVKTGNLEEEVSTE